MIRLTHLKILFLFVALSLNSCNSPKCDTSIFKELKYDPTPSDVYGIYSLVGESFKLELKHGQGNISSDSIYFRGQPFWLTGNQHCNVRGTYIIVNRERGTLLFKKEDNLLLSLNNGMDTSIISLLLLAEYKNKLCILLPKSKSRQEGCFGSFQSFVNNCDFYIFEKE